jgi:hypothetical protein
MLTPHFTLLVLRLRCDIQGFTALGSMRVLGYRGGDNKRVSKELSYGKAERLADAEEAARWWRDNFVR